MAGIEQILIDILLNFVSADEITEFFRDPRTTATIIGCFIAISGAMLGTFLLLRGMALTSDAISHTVLLGIVVAFMVMTQLLDQEPDVTSPWLLLGAAGAGVATVVLTELIYKSGLVKQDAALGLAFPLLFAISIILVSRYVDDVHLDEHTVMVGEIGFAWANTNNHCLENCVDVTITPDHPQAKINPRCINCVDGVSARDPEAEFIEVCENCGTLSPREAYEAGFVDEEPIQVFWPQSVTVTAVMMLLTVAFVTLLYKELKLATFDAALAQALGFRPGVLHYGLMVLVSLVAVGAFDAVGSILVIAFFIIPPATAYLLTDRLSVMLFLSAVFGSAAAFFGYELARGNFFGLLQMQDVLALLNDVFDTDLDEVWQSSVSASIVLMMFFFFLLAWVASPKYGLVSTLLRRANQRRRFDNQVVLGHIYNHQATERADEELAATTLHEHFRWSPAKMGRVMTRLRAANLVKISPDNRVMLTEHGEARVTTFRERNLAASTTE